MVVKRISFILISLLPAFLLLLPAADAAVVEYELVIDRQPVNMTGTAAWGMTINGSIPGPTLRFAEGDLARILVRNNMDADTSIHWHGILVPPGMDGVPYLSFPPIKPGDTFVYEFPIRQNGTYWYHSHSSLQEQSGVYGAIVIEPQHQRLHADRDHVVLVSDWTDENPHSVLRTLKRGSEWYALEKGSSQSILGAARLGLLGCYFTRELQRMPPMDIADVAYDRFLANGRPESFLEALPGETIRLRIINGSSTTYFHLEFAGGPMTIIAADGQDVEPVRRRRFLVGVAETYDLLIETGGDGAYEFRATAHDGSGYASVWIGSGPYHPAPDIPRPNMYHPMDHGTGLRHIFALTPAGVMGMPDRAVRAGTFDRPGMMGMAMEDMDHMHHPDHEPESPVMQHEHGMDHGAADHSAPHIMGKEQAPPPPAAAREDTQTTAFKPPAPPSGRRFGKIFHLLAADASSAKSLAVDGMAPERPGTPYGDLTAVNPTAFGADRPVREIRLTLDGDMERYVWMLNNRVLAESDVIRIRAGEVVRLIMINRTMMHHPMHLHGHFFRVVNGRGDFAPLKHTVDVAPMSTTVIEFNAVEPGDWFFHCHLLYHMESGMARVVHYEDYAIDPCLPASARTSIWTPGIFRERPTSSAT
ncbi:MAG TPA: copper oxidase [Desulfobacteraceae bacterium]|nr:copper oxidase [Desulfobacteraceae bacterium]